MEFEIIGGLIVIRKIGADLQGSEKQVAWADDIRRTQIKRLCALVENAAKRGGKTVDDMLDLPQNGTTMRRILDHLSAKTYAKFWIDNRTAIEMGMIKIAHSEIV